MKKKTLVKSSRAIARLTANVDGKYKGLTQKEVETAIAHLVLLEMAMIQLNYRSLVLAVRKVAVKKVSAFKRKKAKAGRKA